MKKILSIIAMVLFVPMSALSDKISKEIVGQIGAENVTWVRDLIEVSLTVTALSVMIYFGAKYHKSQMNKKDAIIAEKDAEIKDLNFYIRQSVVPILSTLKVTLDMIYDEIENNARGKRRH